MGAIYRKIKLFGTLFIASLAFSLIGNVQSGYAQTDTTFWFAVPEVANSHGDRPIFVRFTSQGQAATVTVDLPANPAFAPIVTNVAANGLASINLTSYIDSLENFPANAVLNKGLRIHASSPITAYFETSPNNNPDIFSLKGKSALGLSFMIPGQDIMDNAHGRNVFDIVATEDNTEITITPSKALEGGRAAGVPFTITLHRGQTFSCRAAGITTSDKLIGSTVTANKPIAITIIDDSVRGGEIYNGGCFDLLGDQLIPIEQLGLEFIIQRGFLDVHNNNTNSRTERVIIMATQNNTAIYLDGSATAVTTLSSGQTYHRRMGANLAVTHIKTDKPVYVLHISGFGCETGQAVIPAISCTGSSLVGFRRSTAEQMGITITTRNVHKNNFQLNGAAYPIVFTSVPGTNDEWVYARILRLLNDTSDFNTQTAYLLRNTSGNFHLGIINGGSTSGCRYGYFSGFATVTVTATSNSTIEAPACQASPVFIEADSTALATYSWTGPNGLTSNLRRLDFNQVTFADTGLYTVTATVDNCISSIDSITIRIKEKPNVAIASNTGPYCDGENIQLFADTVDGVSYLWTGPDGFSSTNQNPVITNASFVHGGTYRLITLLDGCSSDTTTTDVYVYPVPVITPLGATTFCRYDSVVLRTGGGLSYAWFFNGQLINGQSDSLLTVSQAGFYTAVVTNSFGCKDTADQVEVAILPLPDKSIQSSAGLVLCTGDSTFLFTNGGYTYAWYKDGVLLADKTDSAFYTSSAGQYQVISTSVDGCTDSSSILTLSVLPVPVAQPDTSLENRFCSGDSIRLLSKNNPAAIHHWLRNDSLVYQGNDTVYWTKLAGDYRLVVEVGGCTDTSATITLTEDSLPTVLLTAVGAINFCANDSATLKVSGGHAYQWLRNDSVVNGATDSVLTVSIAANWSVIATNSFGCSDTSNSISTTVNPLPTPVISAGSSTTFCSGDSVVLTATGGTSYQWMRNDTVVNGATDSIITVSTAASWTVIATNSFGCSDTSNVISTTVNPLPTTVIAASSSTNFCFGDSMILTASGGTSYQWLRNDTIINGATDSELTVSTAASWSVIATNAFGCSDTSNVISTTVNPLPTPVIAAGSSTTFCSGDSVVLTATGGTSYQWMRNDTVVNGATDSILTVSMAASWTVIATNSFGCSDTSNVISTTVNPLPIPVIAAGSSTTFCSGDSVILTASGGHIYQWLRNDTIVNGATDSVLTVSTAAAWSVVATNSSGCSDTSNSISTTVNPLPTTVIVASSSTTFCFGDSVILNASGGTSYQWLRNDTVVNGATDSILTVSTTATWSVIATNSFGCSDTSNSISTTVNPLPTPMIAAGSSTTFCSGDSVILTASGGSSYQWLRNDTIINGATDSVLTVSTAASWSIIATNSFGCSDTSNVISTTVNPLPIPVITAGSSTTFCFGDSVILSASGSISYQWLRNDTVINGATDSVLTVSTAASWSVIATNTFGCSDTSNSITTTVNPLPIPVIAAGSSTTFCFGDSVILTASGGISYQWLRNDTVVNGATDSVLTISTAAAWSVIATNSSGCSDTSNVISTTVNPLPIPVITAGSSTTFCSGDSVVLTATGGTSYQWLRNDTIINGATDSLLTVSTAASWLVIATNTSGCSDTSNVISTTVHPLPIPVIAAGSSTTFCSGDSVILTASGGVSYQWLRNDTVIAGTTDTVLTVSTAASWSVIATNSFGCSDTSNSISTTVNPLPTPVVSAGSSTIFCFGDSAVLTASGGISYQWLRNDTVVNGVTDSVLTVSIAANWSVIATNAFGCSDTSNSISTTVNPLPTPVIAVGSSTTFCSGDSVVLTATGGTSYQWMRNDTVVNGATDSVLTVSTAAAWSVVATISSGCSDTSNSISTTVNPLPTPVIAAGSSTTFCFGDSVILTATGGNSYQWLRNDTVVNGVTDSVLTVSIAANWSVIATNAFGCSDTSNSISTTVNPLPTPVIAAGSSTTFCFDDSVILTATGGISYQWLRNDTVVNGATDSVLTVSTAASWSVIATNTFGCSDTSNVISTTVNPLPIPVIAASSSTTFCSGDSVILTASGGISHQWLRNDTVVNGATDSVLTVSTAANWSVIATNAFGCSDTSNSISTTVNPLPTPVIAAGSSTTFCFGDSVVLTATGGTSFQWLRNDTVVNGATDSVLTVSTAASWSVIATDTFGCSDTSNMISTTVNPLPTPVIAASSSTTFCFGDSVILTASGGTSYQWLRNDTVVNGATDSVLTVSTAANWSVIATNAFGCSDTSNSISTTVNPLPTPVIAVGSSTTFCSGDSVILTATGGHIYQWLRNDTIISGTTDSVLTVSTAASWSVIATNSFGCSDTSNVISTTVNPLPIPVIAAGSSTTFCSGDSVILTASGGHIYQWLRNDTIINGATDSVLAVSTPASWSVIATNSFGCIDTSNSISTTVNSLPTPVIAAGSSTTFCSGDSVILTASGGVSYQWLRNDTVIAGTTDTVLTVSTAASWSVIATNSLGCSDTSNSISTTVNPLPTPVVSAGSSTTFCLGDSAVLTASGGISYQWLRNDTVVNGVTDSVLTVSTAASWSIIATNTFGCSDTSNVISTTVNPLPIPVIAAGSSTTFCSGDSVVLTATGGTSYQWLRNDTIINGATDSLLTVSTAASWSVIATNTSGCSDTSNVISTTVHPLPIPVIAAGSTTTFCSGDSVILTASGGSSYQWLRNDTIINGATDSVITVSTTASWSVIATNSFGCSDTSNVISITVNHLPIPVITAGSSTTFCIGDSVILTTSGGVSYQWLRNDTSVNGATDSVLTVSTAASWSVIATNSFGCSDTSNVISTTVNPLPIPVIAAGSSTTFCFGDSVVLTASGGISYQWLRNDTVLNGATDSVLTVSTAAAWSVVATNSSGCSDTSNVISTTVNSLPTPVIAAGSSTNFCFGDSVVLTANGGISYQWLRNDTSVNGATDSVLTVSTAANWSVIATNAFGCSDTSNVISTTVNPLPTPVIAAGSSTTFCSGDSVILTASGGTSYQWLRNDSIINGATDSVLTVSTAAAWSVIATNSSGCSDTSNVISTTVNPLPTPLVSAGSSTTFCSGDSVILTASGGVSYQWLRNDTIVNGATDSVLTVSTAAAWSVIATNSSGCSDTSNVISTTVNQLPIPVIAAGSSTTYCSDDSVILTATGGNSYQWLRNDTIINGATDSVLTVSSAASWSVIATNSSGCSDTSNVISTTVNPLPTPVITAGSSTTFCSGDSVILTASGGTSYQWLRNDTIINGATDSVITVSIAASWSVIAFNSFGCSDTSNVISTTVNPLPLPVIAAGSSTTFCSGDSVILTASGGVSYQWLRNDTVIAGDTDTVLTVTTAASWSVIATNSFGCSDTSNVISTTVNPLPIPVIAAGSSTTFCFGDSVVLTATGGTSFQWLRNDTVVNGATDSVLTVSTAASWSVIATNSSGCSDTSNVISTSVNPLPIPVIAAGSSTTFCSGDSVILTASGGVSYQWLRNDTVIAGATDTVLTVTTAASWSVIATNTFGCSDTSNVISTSVNPLPIPVIAAGSSATFCSGDSVILTASGGISYQWLRNDTVITGATDTVLTVTTAASWSVIASNSFGCSDTSNVISTTVNPLPTPVIAAGSSSTFCFGDSVILTATGGHSYQWLKNDTVVNGATDSVLTVSTAASWSVIATNTFGCSDTSNVISTTVNPLPIPVIAAGSSTTFCSGDSVILTANGGISYQWLRNDTIINGATDSLLTVSTAASWSVIATNSFGCSDTSNVISTTVNPLPTPVVTAGSSTSFCSGDSVILTASGGVSYQWLRNDTVIAGATDSVLTASTAASWSVIAFNSFGCSDTSNSIATTVNQLPTPVIAAGSSTTFCSGDSVVLTASGGNSYQWLRNDSIINGATDSVLTISTAASWSVIATNTYGCSDTSNVISTTVNPLPTPVIAAGSSTIFCSGDSVNLTANGGISYQWLRNDTILNGATDSVLTVSTAAAWSVIATNSSGCIDTSNSISTTVNSLPTPVIAASSSTAFCSGDSVILTASGGTSYQWLRSDTIINGATDSVLTVSTAASWSIIATNTFGCSDTSNVISTTVNLLPTPVIAAGSSTTFCSGDSVVLTASGGTSFQWLRNDTIISGATDSVLTVSTAASWSVIATNTYSCSDTTNVISTTVNPLPIPVIAAGSSTTFCFGDSVVLTANGGISYQWLRNDTSVNGATDSVLTVSTAANWSVIATDAFGCSDTSNSISTTVNSLPTTVIAAGSSTTFCSGDSVILTASGGHIYQWLRNDTLINGATDSVLTVSTAASWSVIATNSFGCSDTSNVISTTVNPLPIPVIAAGSSTTFCSGDSVILTASRGISYQWLRNDTVITGATDTVLAVTTAASWSVIASNSFGCSDTSNVISTTVNPLPTPVIAASSSTTFCFGDSVILTATGGLSYQWLRNDTIINGATDSLLTVSTAASWSVIATNSFGCSDTTNVISTRVNALPTPVLVASGSTTFCMGDSIILTASGGNNYKWLRNDTLITGLADSTVTVYSSANYQVIVGDSLGCTARSTILSIQVNSLPQAEILLQGQPNNCDGDSVLLVASAANTYQWLLNGLPIPTATNGNLMATASGSYSVVAYNANGCADTSTALTLHFYPRPQPIVQFLNPPVFCPGDTVVMYTISAQSYQWFRDGVAIAGATDSFYLGTVAGQYSVSVQNTNGCQQLSPQATTQVLSNSNNYRILANNVAVCAGDSALLQINAVPNTQYQWMKDGIAIPNANQTRYYATSSGLYSCLITYNLRCNQEVNGVYVHVNPIPPSPIARANGPVCRYNPLELYASMVPQASYSWKGPNNFRSNQANPVIPSAGFEHAGWYKLRINMDGCDSYEDSVYVAIIKELPEIEIQGRRTYCPGETLKLNADSLLNANYRWILPTGDTIAGRLLRLDMIEATDAETYTLEVSRAGCVDYYTEVIRVIALELIYPTAFTPNGDGLNETFFPVGNYQGQYELEVYDRWGKKIFHSFRPEDGWDGTVYGSPSETGTYTYVYRYEDCSNRPAVGRGSIQLIR